MYCAACGKETDIKGRVPFRERCPHCDAALHACVHCCFHDTGAYNQCRETKAERQVEKKRENRCEYFSPKREPPSNHADGTRQASGASRHDTAPSRDAFAALFKKEDPEK